METISSRLQAGLQFIVSTNQSFGPMKQTASFLLWQIVRL